MIRVTVELIPHGVGQARQLAVMEIANDGTGDTCGLCHYDGILHAEYTPASGRKGRVTNFNRQTQSVWSLIGAFLKLWGHTKHSPKDLSNGENRNRQTGDTLNG